MFSKKGQGQQKDNVDEMIEHILNQDTSKWDPLTDSDKFEERNAAFEEKTRRAAEA